MNSDSQGRTTQQMYQDKLLKSCLEHLPADHLKVDVFFCPLKNGPN